ncbi:MAG TPA: hypothetical protein G4O04_03675 [Anaerolineae bacterium]|nr:hypothetical protein [Anaerolineae bacterium]
MMALLGIILAGLGLAWLGYAGVSWALERTTGYHHLLDFRASQGQGQAQSSRAEKAALGLFARFFSLDIWERRLRWAQRSGRMTGQTLGNIALQSLGFGFLGLVLALITGVPVLSLAVPLGLALPWVRLYSAAEDAKEATTRDLPAVASIVAAELAAGTPPEEAVRRAAVLPGPLAGLLADALTFARETGRPLFAPANAPVRGAVVEVFSREGVPALAVFARQLNVVAVKGAEGARLMSGVAQSLADEYQALLERRIEQLDSRIWPVIALFFFFPFVAVLLLVNLVPALGAL